MKRISGGARSCAASVRLRPDLYGSGFRDRPNPFNPTSPLPPSIRIPTKASPDGPDLHGPEVIATRGRL